MKTVTVIILVAVFIFASIWFDGFISRSVSEVTQLLQTAETPDEVQAAIDLWEEKSSIMELIIDHTEIDLLNEHLWETQVCLENKNGNDFLRARKLALEMLKHIAERNTLGINNIF